MVLVMKNKITLETINSLIVEEFYFTGEQGVIGSLDELPPSHIRVTQYALEESIPPKVRTATIAILVLENGFTVVGTSNCVDPANFDVKLGQKIAREDAINKLWPILGYQLQQEIYDTTT